MTLRGASELEPVERNTLLYSVLIPAHNEEKNIIRTVQALAAELRAEGIPFEIVVVNDNSTDATPDVVAEAQDEFPELRLVHNAPPGGLGRAVRFGLQHYEGDALVIVMADLSDNPKDIVTCYRMLEVGYDCAFGSRFLRGGRVAQYPPVKLFFNRLGNYLIRLMFLTHHNDMTNAFKAYRRHVIEAIRPLHACHFNITIEMSLSALVRHYNIAMFPIEWSGRTWGQSSLRVREMGRRYVCTLLMIWFERLLILDDLLAEKEARGRK